MIIVGDTAILNGTVNIPFDSLSGITWSGLNNPNCPNCLTQPVTPIVTSTYSVSITNHAGSMERLSSCEAHGNHHASGICESGIWHL